MLNYLNKRWIRYGTIIGLAILFRFSLDVVYSLMYRNYVLIQPAGTYFYTLLLTFFTLESIYYSKEKLNKLYSWDKGFSKRFGFEWLINSGIGIFFVIFTRWVYLLLVEGFTFVALIDEVIILGFILFVSTILTVVDGSIFLLEKWRFSLAEIERFKKENAEFQFEALRAQVNPHFLFNSLNTLSSLIYESHEKAELFIRELSDVYRYILENRGQELVEFSKELDIASSYIHLMRLRFDKNLEINLDIDKQAESKMIAPMTLQLLIENAVKHNIISRKKPLKIDISADGHSIEVGNNLQKKEIHDFSSEMGLKNIQSRYSFLTDKKVEIIETENEFKVVIPLIDPI